eukprot:6485837-Amphidinium_carterae.1
MFGVLLLLVLQRLKKVKVEAGPHTLRVEATMALPVLQDSDEWKIAHCYAQKRLEGRRHEGLGNNDMLLQVSGCLCGKLGEQQNAVASAPRVMAPTQKGGFRGSAAQQAHIEARTRKESDLPSPTQHLPLYQSRPPHHMGKGNGRSRSKPNPVSHVEQEGVEKEHV